MNYPKMAFSEVIKKIQRDLGSRDAYERVENQSYKDGLTATEIQFIGQMDSFYMASFGENGFPYIQHRGGPKNFIHVLDSRTLALIDFSGNRQYISVGNIALNSKVSLILVSYPLRARLKIYAEAKIIQLDDDPELFERLKPVDYKFRPERMMVFHIKAYDWNCPQHITPRYTSAEIEKFVAPKEQEILELKNEVTELRSRLNQYENTRT